MTIRFERVREILKVKAYKEFLKFMEGQTVDEYGVYDNDFLRFVKGFKVVD